MAKGLAVGKRLLSGQPARPQKRIDQKREEQEMGRLHSRPKSPAEAVTVNLLPDGEPVKEEEMAAYA